MLCNLPRVSAVNVVQVGILPHHVRSLVCACVCVGACGRVRVCMCVCSLGTLAGARTWQQSKGEQVGTWMNERQGRRKEGLVSELNGFIHCLLGRELLFQG